MMNSTPSRRGCSTRPKRQSRVLRPASRSQYTSAASAVTRKIGAELPRVGVMHDLRPDGEELLHRAGAHWLWTETPSTMKPGVRPERTGATICCFNSRV